MINKNITNFLLKFIKLNKLNNFKIQSIILSAYELKKLENNINLNLWKKLELISKNVTKQIENWIKLI